MSSRVSKPSGTTSRKRSRSPGKMKDTISLPQETKEREVNLTTGEAPDVPVPQFDRDAMIAQAAYFRAEKRGFRPGEQLDDWLAAEAEITAQWLQKIPPAGDEPRG